MKSILSLAIVFAVATTSFAQGDKKGEPWFDMENCAICKNMAQVENFMEKVKWESHIIDNGLLSVTVVPDDMKKDWAKMMEDVQAVVTKAEQGEEMEMCGFCTSFGSLVATGAKKTELETAGGHIMMLTSDDPEIVEKIHAHAKKTLAEHEKMMKLMQQHGSNQK